MLDLVHSQVNPKTLHDSFHKALDQSEDSFLHVADYFSKGIFSKSPVANLEKDKNFPVSVEANNYFSKELLVKPISNTSNSNTTYGPGAEAKIRLLEGNRQPGMKIYT